MTARWIRKNSRLVTAALVVLVSPAVGWLLYGIFEPQTMMGAVESGEPGIIREIVTAQGTHGLRFLLASIPLLLAICMLSIRPRFAITWPVAQTWMERHTKAIDSLPDSQIALWVALAAGLGLYVELMIIRIHASYFQLFAYFKNVSLLSCFLGLGIGYARGSRRPLSTPVILPLLALQVICMYVLRFSLGSRFLQNPVSEQLTLGMAQAQEISRTAIAYGFVVLIFTFNALCFVPLGHLASHLMMRQRKLIAYSWNLIGSLIGIIVFSLISFLWLPPIVWVIVTAVGVMAFLRSELSSMIPSAVAVIAVVAVLSIPVGVNQLEVYSPYQILTLSLSSHRPPVIKTSNTYYQRILDLSRGDSADTWRLRAWSEYYELPYRVKPKPDDVLIVGSGAGNDVAAAVRNGAGTIDAVEIDPAILRFGKELHPEEPYQARNVNARVDDARAFIGNTGKKYDLIVYGLLDSHTLLSGRSGGIRLDSYIYTVEALREARSKLKNDGVMSLTFSVMGNQLGRKLYLMLEDAFDGRPPTVYRGLYDSGYTFLAGDHLDSALAHVQTSLPQATQKFASSALVADKSTDDWPFFYMPVRKYPVSYAVMIMLMLGISVVLVREFVPGSWSGFSLPCFFLGAGFMLVETKGITELALVYGSTWMVISIVVAAILIMAFLANLLVIRIGNPSRLMTYGLLFVSLVAGLGMTFANVNRMTPWLGRAIMTSVLTIPLFFSGFAFSNELRNSDSVAVALSSNLLGAMLGGFLEYNSMYFGFRSLYIFALVMYVCALLGTTRSR
jgi:spermidine synthase